MGGVAFTTTSSGDFYSRYASGAGEAGTAGEVFDDEAPERLVRDGRFPSSTTITIRPGSWDLSILPLSGDRKPVPFVVTPADETEGLLAGREVGRV